MVIDHGDGWTSTYAHCSKLNVKAGQHVTADEIIAQVGSTGQSTGPHLHFEIHHQGKALDPQRVFIDFGSEKSKKEHKYLMEFTFLPIYSVEAIHENQSPPPELHLPPL